MSQILEAHSSTETNEKVSPLLNQKSHRRYSALAVVYWRQHPIFRVLVLIFVNFQSATANLLRIGTGELQHTVGQIVAFDEVIMLTPCQQITFTVMFDKEPIIKSDSIAGVELHA